MLLLAVHLLGALLAAAGIIGLLMMALALQAAPFTPAEPSDRRWVLISGALLAAGSSLLIFI